MKHAPSFTDEMKNPSGSNLPVCCLAVLPKSGVKAADGLIEFPLYWVAAEQSQHLIDALREVLADPLLQEVWLTQPHGREHWARQWGESGFRFWAERQYLPGVTDNLGKTVEEALHLAGIRQCRVASGTGLLFPTALQARFDSNDAVEKHCRYRFYHPVTDRFLVHDLAVDIKAGSFLDMPQVHLPNPEPVKTIPLNLEDSALEALSKERLLALNVVEMRAIRDYYLRDEVKEARSAVGLPEWPTDVELEILAQTWSEHCKHKIFNATISYHDKSTGKKQSIHSLYKTYIQGSTRRLQKSRKDLLSVFEDNAGVVKWNDDSAICFKVETHNSPSALEPYGGALTGILGVNRDILGTGLGAKPIFNTDVFCFAYPSAELADRPTLLPAEAIIQGVRKGVQDGGNKSGIPTVNGGVYFHPGYRAKPLVYCGTGGILPLNVHGLAGYQKFTRAGDTIVMAGGRVGKDGIHGATFSSEAMHEGSPVSAVQIGDPFTQKRLLDFVLEARDAGLLTGITDNGAGGLSSSVGEMAQLTGGATLELDHIPLKYPGLADYEIVISESQERMTLSTRSFAKLKQLAHKHSVEVTAVGEFHRRGCFEVMRAGKHVAMLDLQFLHKGAPDLMLSAEWEQKAASDSTGKQGDDLGEELLQLLSHPNICSREAIIRQYDHEVQGASVVKPLMGKMQNAPCDAAVLKPVLRQEAGLVVSNGLCPQLSAIDTYLMAICAVDEAVRNAVCVGADPSTLSLLDNFCWPDPVESARNPDGKTKLAQLVRACQGLSDAVAAFQAPLISGKDSMKNDFDDGTVRLSIPPTLLISAIARIEDVNKAVTMEFKNAGDSIYLLAAGKRGFACSQYAMQKQWESWDVPALDLDQAAAMYARLHEAILMGMVRSCHDLSEGGLAVALAECVIGSGLGAEVDVRNLAGAGRMDWALFAEGPAHLLISIPETAKAKWDKHWSGFSCVDIGSVSESGRLKITNQKKTLLDLELSTLTQHWNKPLPLEETE